VPKTKKEDVVEAPPVGAVDDEDGADELDGDEDADEDDEDGDVVDVPASAAGKASAQRLIDLLVEKGALQLRKKQVGPKLVEAVAKILEAPGSTAGRATRLSDTIVDSDDVDELFVDDDTLVEILKRW
jgi:hypothetical protein